MSGGFPLLGSLSNGVVVGPASTGLTASSSPNTKGSWNQITASTASDIGALLVMIQGNTIGSFQASDIGIGGAGVERVIINNLVSFRAGPALMISEAHFLFPIYIPSGTRVAARCQGSAGSDSVLVSVIGFDTSFTYASVASAVDDIGFQSSASTGTALTPGSNIKGAYAQLTAASAADYSALMIIADPESLTAANSANLLVDIAVGASGSETVIIPDLNFVNLVNTTNNQGLFGPCSTPFFPISIPSGTRIAARAQGDAGSPTNVGVTVYGLRQ